MSASMIPDSVLQAATHQMRVILMSTGAVTLDQVNRFAEPFAQTVIGTIAPGIITEAEKRGAVKALTYVAEITRRSAAEMAATTGGPVVEGVVLGLAASLNQYADQIESGEATI